jgi:hypothetical protein
MWFFRKKKETNYGKIVAITVAITAGVCAVAYFLFKLYEKHMACKLVLDEDDCLCDCDCDCECDCEECDCCDLCCDCDEIETEIEEVAEEASEN